MSDTINKITVYKLNIEDIEGLAFAGYVKVKDDFYSYTDRECEYKLFFLNRPPQNPSWGNVFQTLDIDESLIPKIAVGGFIFIIKINESYYAFCGGIGHIALKKKIKIIPRFGVKLAEKILLPSNLKGLTQKDTSGNVVLIDRIFRGTRYNPNGDINNLKRILKKSKVSH